jgi:hypothetical protein
LIGFAFERYPLALSCAAGNVEFQDLFRLDDFVAFALLASLFLGDDLAGALAVAAGNGFLGDEAGTDLAEDLLST